MKMAIVTVPYSSMRTEIYHVLGRITNPATGRKIKVYFTSQSSKSEATKQDKRVKTENRKRKKAIRKVIKW